MYHLKLVAWAAAVHAVFIFWSLAMLMMPAAVFPVILKRVLGTASRTRYPPLYWSLSMVMAVVSAVSAMAPALATSPLFHFRLPAHRPPFLASRYPIWVGTTRRAYRFSLDLTSVPSVTRAMNTPPAPAARSK
jgi:hypothetical protein